MYFKNHSSFSYFVNEINEMRHRANDFYGKFN